ncbi:unnamed protein product [Trichogramma brassicae]|uniref:Uncharacterized protein n=1 Tax=Trichogramma brassicae TaxID=86971 RepID=A0A6H5IX84_9HYME|nr:unnamed protein product [Trichogramma brassicae]
MSSQEAAYQVLSLPLSYSTRTSIYINTVPKNERCRILKNKQDLQKLPKNSEDIYKSNIFDKYENRKNEFVNLCLADFAYTNSHNTRGTLCYLKQYLNYEIKQIELFNNTSENLELILFKIKQYYILTGYKSPSTKRSSFCKTDMRRLGVQGLIFFQLGEPPILYDAIADCRIPFFRAVCCVVTHCWHLLLSWTSSLELAGLVPSCECGSRFCRRWQVPQLLCRLHLVSVVLASGAIL